MPAEELGIADHGLPMRPKVIRDPTTPPKYVVDGRRRDRYRSVADWPFPRSNSATYVGVYDAIRDLFTATNEARKRGFSPATFSFNVPSAPSWEKITDDLSGRPDADLNVIQLPESSARVQFAPFQEKAAHRVERLFTLLLSNLVKRFYHCAVQKTNLERSTAIFRNRGT